MISSHQKQCCSYSGISRFPVLYIYGYWIFRYVDTFDSSGKSWPGTTPEIVWFAADEQMLRSTSNKLFSSARRSNSEASWEKDYNIKSLDADNLQRPETVESLF